MSIASLCGLTFCMSECALATLRRARASDVRRADEGSLTLLWVVIGISVMLGFLLPANVPAWNLSPSAPFRDAGAAVFLIGLALRWYSIVHLGRLFTVDVAIAADHPLIDTGPYRYLRHPSYTGALLAFIGLGLCLCNWGSLLVIFIPTLAAFLRRIRIEEAALSAALGDAYRNYMRRTKRLVPFLY